jgi:hypothetical protein
MPKRDMCDRGKINPAPVEPGCLPKICSVPIDAKCFKNVFVMNLD